MLIASVPLQRDLSLYHPTVGTFDRTTQLFLDRFNTLPNPRVRWTGSLTVGGSFPMHAWNVLRGQFVKFIDHMTYHIDPRSPTLETSLVERIGYVDPVTKRFDTLRFNYIGNGGRWINHNALARLSNAYAADPTLTQHPVPHIEYHNPKLMFFNGHHYTACDPALESILYDMIEGYYSTENTNIVFCPVHYAASSVLDQLYQFSLSLAGLPVVNYDTVTALFDQVMLPDDIIECDRHALRSETQTFDYSRLTGSVMPCHQLNIAIDPLSFPNSYVKRCIPPYFDHSDDMAEDTFYRLIEMIEQMPYTDINLTFMCGDIVDPARATDIAANDRVTGYCWDRYNRQTASNPYAFHSTLGFYSVLINFMEAVARHYPGIIDPALCYLHIQRTFNEEILLTIKRCGDNTPLVSYYVDLVLSTLLSPGVSPVIYDF